MTIPTVRNSELGCLELHLEDHIYLPYGTIPDCKIGEQIGNPFPNSLDGIYKVKDLPIREWLVKSDGGSFLGKSRTLYKAVGAPEKALEAYKYSRASYDESKASLYRNRAFIDIAYQTYDENMENGFLNIKELPFKILNNTGKTIQIRALPKLYRKNEWTWVNLPIVDELF
jgi:hypothetical protein